MASLSCCSVARQQPGACFSGRLPAAPAPLLAPIRRQRPALVPSAALSSGDSSNSSRGVQRIEFTYMSPETVARMEEELRQAREAGLKEYEDLKEWLLFRTWRFGLLFAGYLLLSVSGESAFCELIGCAASYGYLKLLFRDVDAVQPDTPVYLKAAEVVEPALARGVAKVLAAYRHALNPRLLVLVGLVAASGAYNAAFPEDPLTMVETGCLVGGFLSYKVALILKIYEDLKPKPLSAEDLMRAPRPRLPDIEDVEVDIRSFGKSRKKAAEGEAAAEGAAAEQQPGEKAQ